MSFIKRELLAPKRIDIVWDQYQQDSIKSCTREKRGAGVRVKVGPQAKIPSQWNEFLRDGKSKTEYSTSFQMRWPMQNGKKRRISTLLKVPQLYRANVLPMMECTHEEADTRVMVHLLHAIENESANVEVRTVDIDMT